MNSCRKRRYLKARRDGQGEFADHLTGMTGNNCTAKKLSVFSIVVDPCETLLFTVQEGTINMAKSLCQGCHFNTR